MSEPDTAKSSETGKSAGSVDRETLAWQRRLLPLMAGLLIGLTAFFLVASFIQISQIRRDIHSNLSQPALGLPGGGMTQLGKDPEYVMRYVRHKDMAELEYLAFNLRYKQAGQLLLSRIWLIYLGFATGMILAILGASFVLGKLREPESKLEGESSQWKFALVTTSPGLVLTVLGTLLMIITIAVRAEIKVDDRALFLSPGGVGTEARSGGGAGAPAVWPDASKPPAATSRDSALDALEKEADSRLHP